MFHKLSSFKHAARELGAKYNIIDTPQDPALDAVRNHITLMTMRYNDLDVLAKDFTAKMDAAISAASDFALALQTLPVLSFTPEQTAEAFENNDPRQPLNEPCSSSYATEELAQRLQNAANLIGKIDTSGQLKSLLAPYRSFLDHFVQISLTPIREVELPRLDKLKKVADRSRNRVIGASGRENANDMSLNAQCLQLPQPSYPSESLHAPVLDTSDSLSNSMLSRKISRRLRLSNSQHPTDLVSGSDSGRYREASMTASDAQDLRNLAEIDLATYTEQRATLLDHFAKITAAHNQEHAAQILQLVRHIACCIDRFASIAQAQCAQVDALHRPLGVATTSPADTAKSGTNMHGGISSGLPGSEELNNRFRENFENSMDADTCAPTLSSGPVARDKHLHPSHAPKSDSFSSGQDPDQSALWSAATVSDSERRGDANNMPPDTHASCPNKSDLSTTHDSTIIANASDKTRHVSDGRGASPFVVDWFDLADELQLLTSLKCQDDEIAEIFHTCSAVEPALLPRKDLRCMTLRIIADSAGEISPFTDAVRRLEHRLGGQKPLYRRLSSPDLLEHVVDIDDKTSWSHRQVQYIVAKGTNFRNLKHVMLDLNCAFVLDQRLGCNFHKGFYEAGLELYHHVVSRLDRQIPVRIVGRKYCIHWKECNKHCSSHLQFLICIYISLC